MKTVFLIIALLLVVFLLLSFALYKRETPTISEEKAPMADTERFKYQPLDEALKNSLTNEERSIIVGKATERAFTGEYTDTTDWGTYYCKWCGSPLYSSESKFHSDCGWPSFDEEIPHAVKRKTDADGMRTEILCATCGGHLGHVFEGERFTDTNTRHCVNSLSLIFRDGTPVAEAVFAGGCFWGVEHLFAQREGVYSAVSGYTGGDVENPSYQDVLTHTTGHLEAVKVLYNPLEISYEDLTKYFLEIHDPTQANGQGPDIGNQYLSAIFYRSRHEFDVGGVRLIEILEEKGLKIATTLRPAAVFYPAEDYHQDYYEKKGTLPYCHAYIKRF